MDYDLRYIDGMLRNWKFGDVVLGMAQGRSQGN